jgi:hypothetical protein
MLLPTGDVVEPGLHCPGPVAKSAGSSGNQRLMRAETEKLVEDIKQSIGLLRRHL